MKPLNGSCLCGSIQYRVTQIEKRMAHCHCNMCQKFHGAAFSTFAEAKKEHFTWLKGEHLLSTFKAENGTTRQFCKQCGSSMTFSAKKNDHKLIEFSLATLDDDIELTPDAHVFTDSKVRWITICDDLPKFNKNRQH